MARVSAEVALQEARALDQKANSELPGIQGQKGLPLIGDALTFFKDPLAYNRKLYEQYGPVYFTRIGPEYSVSIVHPDAQKMLTLDPDQLFSVSKGYGNTLAEFFPNGLLLRDFSDHRMHRRLMQSSFKNAMLENYMPQIHEVLRKHVQKWSQQSEVTFVQVIKDCLLEVGSKVFLGMELGEDADKINQSFIDMALGSSTPFRWNIPGTEYHRANKGYKYTSKYFRSQIPAKRASDATDMFSLFCKEKQDDGSYFSDDDIVHHVNFLLFAAHDTTTSTLSTMMYEFVRNPEWLEKCRDELMALDNDNLIYGDLDQLETISYCFKETLRMYPPVVGLARRTIKGFDFQGHHIPANTLVTAPVILAHRLPEIYKDPDTFDPSRFAPDREEHKAHPFAWFPFGGGAHKCIGVHFAEMLVKVALFEMLKNYRFDAVKALGEMRYIPFPKPADNLPLRVFNRA